MLDLGAHVGLFSLLIDQRFPGAEIVLFEPDPEHVAVLCETIAKNPGIGPWEIVEACAGTSDRSLPFVAAEGWGSHVPAAGEAGTITVRQVNVFPYLSGGPDLVKINIEGGEWELLSDARFARSPPNVLVLEYHRRNAPGPPEAAARAALEAMGYAVERGRRWSGGGLLWGLLPCSPQASPDDLG